MKTAIVTGASSGIGLEICKTLLKLKYKVIGLARDFSKCSLKHNNFNPIKCDVTDINKLEQTCKELKSQNNIHVLVNNAGVGYFAPHEELNSRKIHKLVATNLEAPLIITQQFLREIKSNKGYIINISSIEAKKNTPFGCAYGATKAGLTHFSNSLFEETRKYGVKVITIHPDITKTNFYDELNFREGDLPETYITPECVANAVEMALTQREGTVITEFTLRPQRFMINRKKR